MKTAAVLPASPAPPESKFPVAVVEWIDSSYVRSESRVTDLTGPIALLTAGYLVRETDDYVAVAHEWGPDDDTYRSITTIPTINVRSIRRLKE